MAGITSRFAAPYERSLSVIIFLREALLFQQSDQQSLGSFGIATDLHLSRLEYIRPGRRHAKASAYGRRWKHDLIQMPDIVSRRRLSAQLLCVGCTESATPLQQNNYIEQLLGKPKLAAPFYVKRVEELLTAPATEPITLADVAASYGISPRAPTRGFQEFRGTSPVAWLKSLRLQRVKDELLAGEPHLLSITEVVLRWGFDHLGHFGKDYRRRFGESASDTLRCSR